MLVLTVEKDVAMSPFDVAQDSIKTVRCIGHKDDLIVLCSNKGGYFLSDPVSVEFVLAALYALTWLCLPAAYR